MFLQSRAVAAWSWWSWVVAGLFGVLIILLAICYCRLMPRHQKSFDEQYLQDSYRIKESHIQPHYQHHVYSEPGSSKHTHSRSKHAEEKKGVIDCGSRSTSCFKGKCKGSSRRSCSNDGRSCSNDGRCGSKDGRCVKNSSRSCSNDGRCGSKDGRCGKNSSRSCSNDGRCGGNGERCGGNDVRCGSSSRSYGSSCDSSSQTSRSPRPVSYAGDRQARGHSSGHHKPTPAQYASSGILDDLEHKCMDAMMDGCDALKTRSLPSFMRPRPRPLSSEADLYQLYDEVSSSKRHRSRMRNEHAALIALSKAQCVPLEDAEVVIVYDQRTQL